MLSIIGFAIGVWGVASGNNYNVITGSDSVSSSAILLTSSIISFGLCAAGIIGGIYMWRPFLIVVSFHSFIILWYLSRVHSPRPPPPSLPLSPSLSLLLSLPPSNPSICTYVPLISPVCHRSWDYRLAGVHFCYFGLCLL